MYLATTHYQQCRITNVRSGKGVYPQTDNGFRLVDIDASKVFVDLWVHLSFAIFAILRSKKTTEMALDQDLTCLIFPFR